MASGDNVDVIEVVAGPARDRDPDNSGDEDHKSNAGDKLMVFDISLGNTRLVKFQYIFMKFWNFKQEITSQLFNV
ncbi:hypothetical protein TSAR_014446 [Trichomalopsis sarcophagae]|uniref:Uncharacterized protein n=1 Tax=Trichomalopsis sarcophagae TaxID=543379 RepID=A0A232EV66_9HYME|nr:hypothetical protein TSAR_014446 [Trichomalopsis sarcophagae]